MNITREVINDLWPLFASGEASPDTRAMVKEFLDHDPEFARLLQMPDGELLRPAAIPSLPPDREVQALKRTRSRLQGVDTLLLLAMVFSGLAFGRIVSDTSWDVSPRNFIITATIAVGLWIAFFARWVWIQRQVYRRPTP